MLKASKVKISREGKVMLELLTPRVKVRRTMSRFQQN
jgi:hypothetical protein